MATKANTDTVRQEVPEDNTGGKRTFSSELGGGQFYPDLPKRTLVDVLDKEYTVLDVAIVEGFDSAYGESDFALILMEDDTGIQFTTLCGGMVVLKKLRKAKDKGLLPLYGAIVKPARYYDIV